MRVTRLRLTDANNTRIVGIKVPYQRLRNWREVLKRGGVQMDADANHVIDLLEKDADEQLKRSKGEDGDKTAKVEPGTAA